LSGGNGRGGATSRKVDERVRFSARGYIKRRSKMGSTRSSDGGDIDASESSGADGIYKGVAVERGGG
jgi:hypothetical protein